MTNTISMNRLESCIDTIVHSGPPFMHTCTCTIHDLDAFKTRGSIIITHSKPTECSLIFYKKMHHSERLSNLRHGVYIDTHE